MLQPEAAGEMGSYDVVIVGGGIAGVAAAWQLALKGGARVLVLEREPLLASHASGRNAAIYRQLEHEPIGSQLALRSGQLLSALEEDEPLLRRTGSLLIADLPELCALQSLGRELGVAAELVGARAIAELVPSLRGGEARHALRIPDDGVLDSHALITRLVRDARLGGAEFQTGAEVVGVTTDEQRVTGVRLRNGEHISTAVVVLAAGAWTAGLARDANAHVPLKSFRRHLALLEVDQPPGPGSPVVWRLDDELYFRPESGGLLASPCDEEEWAAESPTCSQDVMECLARRLPLLAPAFSDARIRRAWAGLRTFSSDRLFVAGEDPRWTGLFHLSGLGGRGMSCGLALGELVAGLVFGADHALAAELSPTRWATRSAHS